MSGRAILTVDQGSTNSKVLVVDPDGMVLSEAARPVQVRFPAPGWVEHDPRELWLATLDAVSEAVVSAGVVPDLITITNQRESVVMWHRGTGKPLGPVVSWQCQRGQHVCNGLRARGVAGRVEELSGLPLSAAFSAAKLAWLLDNVSVSRSLAQAGMLCAGTIDSWLLWNLTGGAVHATDPSNASRTQLFDLVGQCWSAELAALFDIPFGVLADVRPSAGDFGRTVAVGALPAGITVGAMLADSSAALFGHGRRAENTAKVTYGTGSSVMRVTPDFCVAPAGLVATVAWAAPRVVYALEGNVTTTGSALEWTAELLGVASAAEVATLAGPRAGADGIVFVPALAGLGAPWWQADARGVVSGLTRGTTRRQVARAAMEGVAMLVADVLSVILPADRENIVFADGGASRIDALMQIQADVTGCRLVRSSSPHVSAMGVAAMGGIADGRWAEDDLAQLVPHDPAFTPAISAQDLQHLRAAWTAAVSVIVDPLPSRLDAPAVGRLPAGLGV